jgi:hypothetical protein
MARKMIAVLKGIPVPKAEVFLVSNCAASINMKYASISIYHGVIYLNVFIATVC